MSQAERALHFENEYVYVWKTVVSPNQTLEGEGVCICLETHEAFCLSAHNGLSEQREVLVVEMKQPKDRPLPSRPID